MRPYLPIPTAAVSATPDRRPTNPPERARTAHWTRPCDPEQTSIDVAFPIEWAISVFVDAKREPAVLSALGAGQPAISMVMGMSGDAQLRIDSDSDPQVPGPEDMIHALREYLRSHKGGVLGHPTGILPPQFPGSTVVR
jgi:hypothetical protein